MHLCFLGTAVLVLATTEIDKSDSSYYGEQALYYLSIKGAAVRIDLGN